MIAFIGGSIEEKIDSKYKESVKEVAEAVSEKYDLLYGGVNKGSLSEVCIPFREKNRKIFTVIAHKYSNEEINADEVINTNTNYEAISYFAESDILIFTSGGYGTLNEIAQLINSKRNKEFDKKIVFYNKFNFFDDLLNYINKFKNEKFAMNEELFIVVNTLEELKKVL